MAATRTTKKQAQSGSRKVERSTAIGAGTTFLVVLLLLALFVPVPTTFQEFVFRVILAVAAAAFGATIPGLLEIEVRVSTGIALRAAGALALFATVFLLNPPKLVAAPHELSGSPHPHPVLSATHPGPTAAPLAQRPITCPPGGAGGTSTVALAMLSKKYYVIYYLHDDRVALLEDRSASYKDKTTDPDGNVTGKRNVYLAKLGHDNALLSRLDAVCIGVAKRDDRVHVAVVKAGNAYEVFLDYRTRTNTWGMQGALYTVDQDTLNVISKSIRWKDQNWGFYPQIQGSRIIHFSFDGRYRMVDSKIQRKENNADASRAEWDTIAHDVSGGILPGDPEDVLRKVVADAKRPKG